MADNVAITAGSGTSIATDDVGGVQYQRVKVTYGADGSATDASSTNPFPITEIDTAITGQGSQTTAGNNIVLASAGSTATDVLSYRQVALQIVAASGTFTAGAITFEGSNDNSNFQAIPLYDLASPTAVPVTSYTPATSVIRYFAGPLNFRYFRARISTGITGTTTGVQCFSIFRCADFISAQSTIAQATAASLNATVSQGTAANLLANVGGAGAAGASAAGNPVRLGTTARTANPTAVTDGQAANLMSDKMGRVVVVQGHVRDLVAPQTTTITSSVTETTVVTAGGSGVFNDLTSLSITNSSGTASLVTLKDATSGTTRAIWSIAGGGGVVVTYSPPLPQSSANANWTITCGTSVASIYVNAVFVKNI